MRALSIGILGLCLLTVPVAASADVLVVNRGLPTANLNNVSGASRSNVAWADAPQYNFFGDTFTLPGGGGAVYAIDTIRTWIASFSDPSSLYSSMTLFTGSGTSLSATAASPTITLTSYADSSEYQRTSGPFINLYQVDFTGLNLVATGGTTVAFGVAGVGPLDPGDSTDLWFNHASNAAFSGSPQDSADNVMQEYSWDGNPAHNPVFVAPFDSNGHGWDKSSDINVQVFADVPEPASLAVLGIGLLGIGAARRRKGIPPRSQTAS